MMEKGLAIFPVPVRFGVEEPGHDPFAGGVDDLCARRNLDLALASDRRNSVAGYNDHGVLYGRAPEAVDQRASLNDENLWLLTLRNDRCRASQRKQRCTRRQDCTKQISLHSAP